MDITIQDKGKIKCNTCRHAIFTVAYPVICHLHEYEGNFILNKSQLHDKVDTYFYYDLSRMVVPIVMKMISEAKWPVIKYPNCGELIGSNETENNEIIQKSKDAEIDEEIASDFMSRIFIESREFHGKYGEFILFDENIDNDVEQSTKSNYQDSRIEIAKISYLRDARWRKRLASWFYDEPVGRIISRAYAEGAEEGDGDKTDGDKADKGGEDAEESNPYCDGLGDGYKPAKKLRFLVHHVSYWIPIWPIW